MAVSLEQKDEFFQEMFKAPFPLLALWRYPPHPEDSGAWGIGPHTDYGVFTFVLQDDVGGLQIQAKDGTWVDAPNRPGNMRLKNILYY
jgi:isopenicillin N synthase-like dioxygenase